MVAIAVTARVTGRVQGVAYRKWTQARAQALGLTGWVRNLPDGSVECSLLGDKDAVEQMLTDMWSGPGAADVRDVQHEKGDASHPSEDFKILR